jgi:hypothetical protein
MIEATPLTEAAIAQYNEEGWCLLGRVMDDETIETLRAEEAKFRNRPLHYDDPNPNPPTLFRSQMTAYSAPVRDFGLHGPHIPLVQQVLGQNLAWIYTQFVTKFPDANLGKSEFPWHQDNGYAKVLPENNMTIWIALDDVICTTAASGLCRAAIATAFCRTARRAPTRGTWKFPSKATVFRDHESGRSRSVHRPHAAPLQAQPLGCAAPRFLHAVRGCQRHHRKRRRAGRGQADGLRCFGRGRLPSPPATSCQVTLRLTAVPLRAAATQRS